jgi:hypothetical protein
MTDKKWTPGPWVTEILTGCDPNGDEWETDIEVSSTCGKHIHGYDLGYNEDVDLEIKANAHLIAAAPDLYDALEAAEESIVAFVEGVGIYGCIGANDILVQVRTAMAKARGET